MWLSRHPCSFLKQAWPPAWLPGAFSRWVQGQEARMRSRCPGCAIRRWLCGASQRWPRPGLALEKREAGEKRTPRYHTHATTGSFSREWEASSPRAEEPSLPHPGESGREGKETGSCPFLTQTACCQGREEQGEALAPPSATLESGCGDTASRGFLGFCGRIAMDLERDGSW